MHESDGSRPTRGSVQSVDWEREARRIVKALMVRNDCSAKRLSLLLELEGVAIEPRALANRINRGAFSLAFFLQVAHALRVDNVDIRPMIRK